MANSYKNCFLNFQYMQLYICIVSFKNPQFSGLKYIWIEHTTGSANVLQ